MPRKGVHSQHLIGEVGEAGQICVDENIEMDVSSPDGQDSLLTSFHWWKAADPVDG